MVLSYNLNNNFIPLLNNFKMIRIFREKSPLNSHGRDMRQTELQ